MRTALCGQLFSASIRSRVTLKASKEAGTFVLNFARMLAEAQLVLICERKKNVTRRAALHSCPERHHRSLYYLRNLRSLCFAKVVAQQGKCASENCVKSPRGLFIRLCKERLVVCVSVCLCMSGRLIAENIKLFI